jgi:hypothetical protein
VTGGDGLDGADEPPHAPQKETAIAIANRQLMRKLRRHSITPFVAPQSVPQGKRLLRFAQCLNRINLGRSPGRNVARCQSDDDEQNRNGDKYGRVVLSDAKKQRLQET